MRGRTFNREVAEFGEKVMYLRPKSAGVNKLDTRWETGVWIGVRNESGEHLIMTEKGVLEVRTIRRHDESERWDKELLKSLKGLPWKPNPKTSDEEIKAGIGGEPAERDEPRDEYLPFPSFNKKEPERRRSRVTQKDITRFGATPG